MEPNSRERSRLRLQYNSRIQSFGRREPFDERLRAQRKEYLKKANGKRIDFFGNLNHSFKEKEISKGSREADSEKIILDQHVILAFQNRPKKRKDCQHAQRPCPWIGCKHHMLWCFTDRTFIKPEKCMEYLIKKKSDDEILELVFGLEETCVLDVIDKKGVVTLQEIADILGVSRERIRQIESGRGIGGRIGTQGALNKIQQTKSKFGMLSDFWE